ncbi:MAG: hypothetical protein ACOCYE_08060 [Pseudomonadota bacterium]
MYLLFTVAFVTMTALQAAAIQAGLEDWAQLGGLGSRSVALGLALVPFAGPSVAIIAAVDIWGWGFVLPLAVFGGGHLAVLGLVSAMLRIAERQQAAWRNH